MKRYIFSIMAVSLAGALVATGFAFATPGRRVARLSGDGFHGGDRDASGRTVLWVDPAENKICFRVRFRRLVDPTYGSIHSGSIGAGGPLEVTLFNGDRGGRPSPIAGCARNLPRDVLRDIKRHPRRFYVQFDQHVYANSMVRGRIRRP